MPRMDGPRIVVTLNDPEAQADPSDALLKRSRYLDGVRRGGGIPVPLDARATAAERDVAFAAMDGLLITGGGDIDPSRFGEAPDGSDPPDPARDELDEAAYRAAAARAVPVLGICRGMQVVNVFEGGGLVQHLDGHEGESYPSDRVTTHPIEIRPGSRLAEIVGGEEALVVNSYHHQGVTPGKLAPSLRASASANHPELGSLVEGLEAKDAHRWLVGVQCHPERTESSPAALERIWTAFVAACRDRSRG
jgi:putative glutamine amidotransferase